jgi:hypothetical protein
MSEEETYERRYQYCLDLLHQVEALFAQKFGCSIDVPDEDGCVWVETTGHSFMQLEIKLEEVQCMYNTRFGIDGELQEGEYQDQLMQCQDSLQEVAALYAQKYGHDIDELDEDGCVWAKTPESSQLERLEEKLAEVQLLYQDKYGYDLNCGSCDVRVQSLTNLLKEVKALYAEQYGHVVDALDEDGCMWSQTVGCDNVCSDTEFQPLQAALDTVKALFYKKYGHDVDEEEI